MVNALANVILNGDLSVFSAQTDKHSTHKNTVTHTHTQKNIYKHAIHTAQSRNTMMFNIKHDA